jgi:acyl-CoA thioesterase
VNYRDPTNNPITLKNLRLEIKDFNSLPPQNTLAKKLLNDSVVNALTNGNANQERAIDTEQYQLHIRSKRSPSNDIAFHCFSFEMFSDNTLVRCVARLFLSHRLRRRS